MSNNQYDIGKAENARLTREFSLNFSDHGWDGDGTATNTAYVSLDFNSNQKASKTVIITGYNATLYDTTTDLVLNNGGEITMSTVKDAISTLNTENNGSQRSLGEFPGSLLYQISSGFTSPTLVQTHDTTTLDVVKNAQPYSVRPFLLRYKETLEHVELLGTTPVAHFLQFVYTPDSSVVALVPNLTISVELEYEEFET